MNSLNENELEIEINNERKRLSTDRMDISYGELINLYKNSELIIDPEYQRVFRWGVEKQTAFIESLLLSIPVPPIFVAEDEDGIWELVDGVQRVSTFLSFFGELKPLSKNDEKIDEVIDKNFEEEDNDNAIRSLNKNKWILEEGSLLKNIKGLNVDSLPLKYKINLKRSVCRVEILRGQSNISMKYELFKRLNSGGAKLTAQEIRHALYIHGKVKILPTISELSKNEKFKKLISLSPAKKEERYDQELILRFFSYFNNVENINNNSEKFLNSFLEKNSSNENFDLEFYKNIFIKTIVLLDNLNDDLVFKNIKNMFLPSYFEGIMIGISQNYALYSSNLEKTKEKISELKNDQLFKDFSGSASNSKERSKNRLMRAIEIFSGKQ